MRGLAPGTQLPLFWLLALTAMQAAELPQVHYRNTDPGVAYTGSKSCAGSKCHDEIFRRYRQTPMGNSMNRADGAQEPGAVPQPITVYSGTLDRFFEVYREGSDLFQNEYQKSADDRVVFRSAHKLAYVMGSGMNGKSYLVRRGDYLFEAPLSWYSETGKWELSPGYSGADMGFNRPALAPCLLCHNGQPLVIEKREGAYRQPPFRFGEAAIGCESCHGPGLLHVTEMSAGRKPGPITSIVNPAKLAPHLRDDVCMNCHQGGDTRVLQPSRNYTDFRPGTPLTLVSAIFRLPIPEDQRDAANIAETLPPKPRSLSMPALWKNSTLQMSKCYQATSGGLSCLTCHSIHDGPAPEKRAAYYRAKCLACHSETSCALPRATRVKSNPEDNCTTCHMPRRAMAGIDHSSLTSHRIVCYAGQPLPPIAFEREKGLKGLIWVNGPVPGATSGPGSSLPLVTKLAAYGETMQVNPALQKQYLEVLEQLSQSTPDDPLVLAALGRRALFGGDAARAVEYLSRALERGSEATTTYGDLADALAQEGKSERAIEVLKRGIEVAPYTPVLRKSLVLQYIALRQYGPAHNALKQYVELFPEDSFMRGLLGKAESGGTVPSR